MKLRSLFPRSRLLLLCGLVAGSLLLSGCMLFPQSRSQKSGSVVAFLFPKEKPQVQAPSIPVLQLPLRVGLAFVPEADTATAGSFTEMQKQTLLKKTADQFRAQPFVQSIQVVPGAYLRAGGSFDNLDQLRSLLGIDVIVLLSYDQVQFTEDNVFSLAYWTIVGAYFFNGNRNDTHTLVEAVVYDIASRSLLFRAPGVDQTKASTGAAYVERELRKDSGHLQESGVRPPRVPRKRESGPLRGESRRASRLHGRRRHRRSHTRRDARRFSRGLRALCPQAHGPTPS
jgi:rhombotail lipoprotein